MLHQNGNEQHILLILADGAPWPAECKRLEGEKRAAVMSLELDLLFVLHFGHAGR